MKHCRFVGWDRSTACVVAALFIFSTSRVGADTFHVDSTGDDGTPGTLRWAIEGSNLSAGADTINIDALTITLTSALPAIAGEVEIAGAGRAATIVQAATTAFDQSTERRVFEVLGGADVSISDLTARNGYFATDSLNLGGGIRNLGALELTRVVVTANGGFRNTNGGGIWNSGTLVLNECEVSRNRAYGWRNVAGTTPFPATGGGIYSSGVLEMYDTLVSENEVLGGVVDIDVTSAHGGGLYTSALSTYVERCTFTLNMASPGAAGAGAFVAGAFGCGIYFGSDAPDSATIRLSTISGNGVGTGNRGAGIYARAGTLIDSCTIVNNDLGVSGAGGNIYSDGPVGGARATIRNSIVWGGTRNTFFDGVLPDDVTGTVWSRGYNMIGYLGTGGSPGEIDTTAPGNTAEGNLIGINPAILPLADNGGPTPTHELGPTSFARDRGTATDINGFEVATDQRGYSRRRGNGPDIGAVESGEPSSVRTYDLYE